MEGAEDSEGFLIAAGEEMALLRKTEPQRYAAIRDAGGLDYGDIRDGEELKAYFKVDDVATGGAIDAQAYGGSTTTVSIS